jgi:hypothetical protein
MGVIYTIHSMLGERILPVLIVLVALYLTFIAKPGPGRDPVARFFPVLVDIQVLLGILWMVFLLIQGDGARLMSFPFILHPILGLLSAGVAHMAVSARGPFARLGRWAPLAGLVVLLVLVGAGIAVARSA